MEARKWEELPIDSLVEVFGRVGLEMMVAYVPLVCKSWYKATLNPLCWKELDFPDIVENLRVLNSMPVDLNDMKSCLLNNVFIQFEHQGKTYATNFLKLVVDRSGGCATMVKLPASYQKEALTYLADKCPALKKLMLLDNIFDKSLMPTLLLVIGKFKELESLEIMSDLRLKDIVTEIGAHCENFVALSLVSDGILFRIGEEEVMSIVTCLPKIKCLALRNVFIDRENLIKILKGCMQLVHLDVRGCRGFDENDEELSKLASHIPAFECSGSCSIVDTFGDAHDDYDYQFY